MNFRSNRRRSPLAAAGALLAALAVALSAYAAHGVEGVAQSRLETAALFAFAHGAVIAVLAPGTSRRLDHLALGLLLIGVLLFSGALAASVFLGWPTTTAPFGGTLMIAGWVLLALARLRA